MSEVIVWCSIMLVTGPTHIKGIRVAEYSATSEWRVQVGKNQYITVNRNNCFYKDPKEWQDEHES